MKKIFALLAGFLLAGAAFAAVNINTATKDELDKIPGVGPVRAQAIVDYRTKNGPFKSADDLKKVDGIGDKNFLDMKDKDRHVRPDQDRLGHRRGRRKPES